MRYHHQSSTLKEVEMRWTPNGYVAGSKPTSERKRQYAAGHALGGITSAMARAEDARKAKEELALKRSLHAPLTEVWDFKKKRGPYDKPGLWEVEGVRRNSQGRFAKPLEAEQLAERSGLTTAAQLGASKHTLGPRR